MPTECTNSVLSNSNTPRLGQGVKIRAIYPILPDNTDPVAVDGDVAVVVAAAVVVDVDDDVPSVG